MRLVWIHRNGTDRDGGRLDRHYLTDDLSRRVLGYVDTPEYPYLSYVASLYSGNDSFYYTDLDTAKAFLEAQAMIGKRDKDYSSESLETQHGDAKQAEVKSEVKE